MISTIILILFIVIIAFKIKSDVTIPDNNPLDTSQVKEQPIVEGKFTPKTLAKYNGKDDPKIFMAVKRRVFDVSQGAAFYGPGGPYENFAGRDASRGLAKNSFDKSMLTNLNDKIDLLDDLNDSDNETLNGWEEHFENKYKVVGKLYENDEIESNEKDL